MRNGAYKHFYESIGFFKILNTYIDIDKERKMSLGCRKSQTPAN